MSIVEKDSTGAVTDERLFIWAGLSILQERDGTGNITKNHFANGFENLSSGTQYYYTKDHLGSIREITDSSGTLVASYDYSPYGTRTLTSGTDISDFGYTGHFTHAKSGLLLAPYRAYDPQLGRWLSRDPIQEGDGPNLYAYVHNDPINYIDLNGLWGVGFYSSNLSNGFNIGWGSPTIVFTPGFFTDLGHGAQATVDGLLPFSDPFAELGEIFPELNTYDPCDEYSQFSKGGGQFAYATIVTGAALVFFAPEWAYAQFGWKGGELTLTKLGSKSPDLRINLFGGSGYPPHYHRRPGIAKHRPWEGGF